MFFQTIKEVAHTVALRYFIRKRLPKGHIGINSHIHTPSLVAEGSLENIYLGNNVNIDWNNVLYVTKGRFIMKDNSGAAVGLTVITNNHIGEKGRFLKTAGNSNLEGRDIIVEEDVWIGANVTLLAGAKIGRGAIVGAGSVVRSSIPPYSIIIGNPAKIIGFRFTPEEIVEHESVLYPEDGKLSLDKLEKNYNKFYLSRMKEISKHLKI